MAVENVALPTETSKHLNFLSAEASLAFVLAGTAQNAEDAQYASQKYSTAQDEAQRMGYRLALRSSKHGVYFQAVPLFRLRFASEPDFPAWLCTWLEPEEL